MFIGNSFAQNSIKGQYSYTLGKPYKVYNATNRYYFQKGNEILSIKINNSLLAIQKYDSNKLELLSINEYKDLNKNPNKNINIEGILEAKGKYYFFIHYGLFDPLNTVNYIIEKLILEKENLLMKKLN